MRQIRLCAGTGQTASSDRDWRTCSHWNCEYGFSSDVAPPHRYQAPTWEKARRGLADDDDQYGNVTWVESDAAAGDDIDARLDRIEDLLIRIAAAVAPGALRR